MVDLANPDTFHDAYRYIATQVHMARTGENLARGDLPHMPIHYCKFARSHRDAGMAKFIVKQYDLRGAGSILLIGDAFGWTAEAIREIVGCPVVTTDISPWVHAFKNKSDSGDIAKWLNTETYPSVEGGPSRLTQAQFDEWMDRMVTPKNSNMEIEDEDMLSTGSVNRLKGKNRNRKFDFAFSVDVFPWMEDDAKNEMAQNSRLVAERSVHFVGMQEVLSSI